MDLQQLVDRAEITDALHRYARAVDTRDWDLWRSVFTEGAHVDYRSAGGIAGSRGEVADWLRDALGALPMTQHYVTNVEIELDGDEATARAMFFNPMRFPGIDANTECGGWYHHRFVRTPEGWRSRELLEETVWFDRAPPGVGG